MKLKDGRLFSQKSESVGYALGWVSYILPESGTEQSDCT
jgi:hypothetical protein